MREFKLDLRSEKLNIVDNKFLDAIYLEIFTPSILNRLFNEESLKIKDLVYEYTDDVRNVLNYISKSSEVSIYEKVFLVYETVMLVGSKHKTPLYMIPVKINMADLTIKMDGLPMVNPIVSNEFNLVVHQAKNIFELDTVYCRETIMKSGAKIFEEAFITAYDIDVKEIKNFPSFSRVDIESKRTDYSDYYMLDRQKMAIIDQILLGQNIAILGDNKSGKTNLIINAIYQLIKREKRVLFVSNDLEKMRLLLGKFDLLNLTYDLTKTVEENQDIYANQINYLEYDNERFDELEAEIALLEDKYLGSNKGHVLSDALHSLLTNMEIEKIPLTNAISVNDENAEINHADLMNMLSVLEKIERTLKELDFKGVAEEKSFLADLRVADIETDEDDFFITLDEAKQYTDSFIDLVTNLRRKYRLNLSTNISELDYLFRFYQKFNLNTYPKSFYLHKDNLDDLQKLYQKYNNKITKTMALKEMIESVFKEEVLSFDFDRCKKIILGDLYSEKGFDYVQSVITNYDSVFSSIYYYDTGKIKFNEYLLSFDKYLKGPITTKNLLLIYDMLDLNKYVKEYSYSDKYKNLDNLYDDYLYLKDYYTKDFLLDHNIPFKRKNARNHLAKQDIRPDTLKQIEARLKEFILRRNDLNIDYRQLNVAFNNMHAFRIFDKFVSLYDIDTLYNIMSLSSTTTEHIKRDIKDAISLYHDLNDILKAKFFEREEEYHEFIKVNDTLMYKIKDVILAYGDFKDITIYDNIYDLEKFFYYMESIKSYKSGMKYIKEHLLDIKKNFGNYYDERKHSFKNLNRVFSDFKTVIHLFVDFDLASSENDNFYKDIKVVSVAADRLVKVKHSLFNYFYLNEAKFDDMYKFREFVNLYNEDNVLTYAKYSDLLNQLRKFKEYGLVVGIREGKYKNNLKEGVELFYYDYFVKKHFKYDNEVALKSLQELSNMIGLKFKNGIVDFMGRKDIQRLINRRAKEDMHKSSLITLSDLSSLANANDNYFDYVFVDDAQNIIVNDFELLNRKGRNILVSSFNNDLIVSPDSVAGHIKKNEHYYELSFDANMINISTDNRILFSDTEVDMDHLVYDIKKYDRVNILVATNYDRSKMYLDIVHKLEEDSKINSDALLKKVRVIPIDYSIMYPAEKTYLVLKTRYVDEDLFNIFRRILLVCPYIQVYDEFNTLTNAKKEQIKEIDVSKSDPSFTELEKYFISLVPEYQVRKAIRPLNLVLSKGKKDLGIKFYFDNDYEYNLIYEDINKLYTNRVNVDLEIMVVDLLSLYVNKDEVLQEIRERMGE